MTHPTDAAIAQAFREALASSQDGAGIPDAAFGNILRRARELDAEKGGEVDTGNYISDPLYKALDKLYERGWVDYHQKRDFDARGCQQWQDVLDLFRKYRNAPPAVSAADGLTDAQQVALDAAMYGTGYMLNGKRIPPEQVTIYTPPAQAAEAVEAECWRMSKGWLTEATRQRVEANARAAIAAMQAGE